MRGMLKGRRYGRPDQPVSAGVEAGGIAGAPGGDQGYIAYLLERLLYGLVERSNMEFAAYRERLRGEYAGSQGSKVPGQND